MRKILLATAASMGTLLAAAGNANAQPVKPVAPGTILVHLNGYFQAGMNEFGSTFNNYGGSKLNPVTGNGEFRLYPGFDAMTVNGIAYGVQVETRTAFTPANKGVNNNVGSLYVRRAYGYIGMPDYGYVRIGQTDGAFTLSQVGVIEQFGDGNQFAGPDTVPYYVIPTRAQVGEFAYADQGALYGTNKVVLISPAFDEPYLGGKFSMMASYEPNSNGLKQGYGSYCGGGTAGYATCAGLTSYSGTFAGTNLAVERRNTFDVSASYAVSLDGFANKISVSYLQGAPVNYTGGAYTSSTAGYFLNELQVMQVGVQTTYKGLFLDSDAVTLGANVKWGQTLDGYAAKPIGARNALTYIVGGNYVVGPYVLGASFFDAQTAGNYNPTMAGKEARTLSEYGLAVGGNYVIGRDLSLYLQYMYAHSHQPGNTNLLNGNTQLHMVSAGGTFKW
ncbi:porin [Acidocella aromatica]|uniref:Porin n=1 Tax=Acidocella aromatica TaxID=1303579 RepID=A0A840VDU6_9PROT|nr:porin [Acidocella aromatica]MBB5373876.1 hypothetical protein [Acidocella aromatica]